MAAVEALSGDSGLEKLRLAETAFRGGPDFHHQRFCPTGARETAAGRRRSSGELGCPGVLVDRQEAVALDEEQPERHLGGEGLDRLPILSATAMLDCVLSAYFVLTRLAVSRMNLSRAHTLLEQAEHLGLTRGWGRLVAAALLERVRLACLEGRISEGAACLDRLDRVAQDHPAPKSCAWSDIHRYSALARAHLALSQDRAQSAISILKNLQQDADDVHSDYFGLRVAIYLATARLRAGDRTDALVAFRKVLDVGVQAGLYQTILDQGPEIGDLLLRVRKDPARTEDSTDFVSYLDRLVGGYSGRYQSRAEMSPTPASAGPLSVRERDILNRIAQGQSDKEIARMLSISPETVKSHIKHIFSKLNVQKRAQAVARAQSFGLVGTP